MHRDIERILYTEEEIARAVERVAQALGEEYGAEGCTVVSVLKGSCVFTADLIRRLSMPLGLSFAVVESYREGTQAGTLESRLMPPESEVRGRRVLLVDDILDTGGTLSFLTQALLGQGAEEVKSCVLMDKPARRQKPFEADYRLFEVEDVFVVGYGLDFAGRYRNLPYVGVLHPEVHGLPVRPTKGASH